MILMHDKLKFENHDPCLYLQVNLEAHYYHYKSGVLVIVFRGLLVYTYIDTEKSTFGWVSRCLNLATVIVGELVRVNFISDKTPKI